MIIGSLRMAIEEVAEMPVKRARRWRTATKKGSGKSAPWNAFLHLMPNIRKPVLKEISAQMNQEYQKAVDKRWPKYLGMLRYSLPVTYAKYPKKSVAALTIHFLSAKDKLHKKYLKQTDHLTGTPVVICSPDKIGRLRAALYNKVVQQGTYLFRQICELNEMMKLSAQYAAKIVKNTGRLDEDIARANRSLNNLVESFRLPDFTPFIHNGDSHIDFVLERNLDKQTGKDKRELYLDIRVATYEATD